ncbi:hypothetical protein KM043_017841 [Ampulex compressa]|nr:hypothetical protein KM043_017841 [Ampulex compressa]
MSEQRSAPVLSITIRDTFYGELVPPDGSYSYAVAERGEWKIDRDREVISRRPYSPSVRNDEGDTFEQWRVIGAHAGFDNVSSPALVITVSNGNVIDYELARNKDQNSNKNHSKRHVDLEDKDSVFTKKNLELKSHCAILGLRTVHLGPKRP